MSKFTQFEVLPGSQVPSLPALTDEQVFNIAEGFLLPPGILFGWWMPLPSEDESTMRLRIGAMHEDGRIAEGEFTIDPLRMEVDDEQVTLHTEVRRNE